MCRSRVIPRTTQYFVDVVRRTNTTLDVLLVSRIDDYWNVDGDRELSGPCTCFTQFTILNEKPSDTRGLEAVDQNPSNVPA